MYITYVGTYYNDIKLWALEIGDFHQSALNFLMFLVRLNGPRTRTSFFMRSNLMIRAARRLAPKPVLNVRRSARHPFEPINGAAVRQFMTLPGNSVQKAAATARVTSAGTTVKQTTAIGGINIPTNNAVNKTPGANARNILGQAAKPGNTNVVFFRAISNKYRFAKYMKIIYYDKNGKNHIIYILYR